MSERDAPPAAEPSLWQAWQAPPTFLDPIDSAVLCATVESGELVHETLHPLVYGSLGVMFGAGLVGVVALHEMRGLLARAKTLGFEAPSTPSITRDLDNAPPTAAGNKERRTE
jgi:hypothetical protein